MKIEHKKNKYMLQTSSDSGNIPVLPEIEVAGSIASVRTGADWQPGICHVGRLVRRLGGPPRQMLEVGQST